MRKEVEQQILLAMTAALALNGCGAEKAVCDEREMQTEAQMEINLESLEQKSGSFAHWEYTGYEDEWNWGGEEPFMFANQDYDNDGLCDRVYRERKADTEFCHYRIEFGNGIAIDMDKDIYFNRVPHVMAADLNGNGENEIIFSATYDTSTDMRVFGDMVVYEKQGDFYEKANLPFQEREEGYTQEVAVHYEVIRDRLIQVSIDGYETLVPFYDYHWEELSYGIQYDGITNYSNVWDNYLIEKDGKMQLVCKIHLFDQWSNCGLFAVLGYEDGKYIVDRWIRTNDEFDSTIDTDSFWVLEDYLMCSQEMETNGQTVRVELWLDKGVYGSEEEFVPGGGVYEDNFAGEYRLLVRDEEETILSERNITKDITDIDRLNFPGAFEIMVKDYNQDACPDFTIGTYGSSSMNVYALYTIWENGEIGLIGKDILNCSPADFSAAFESGIGKTFYGSMWDNSIGEMEQITYEWNEDQKIFEEK